VERAFSWNTVMFRGASFERRVDVSTSPYTMIRGEDFFAPTLRELESQGVAFRWACSHVDLLDNAVIADGRTCPFDAVIDAAFDAKTAQSMMWQSFAGVWVTSECAVFDPSTAILMDLHESSPEAPVSFLYILPTSERSALLEHTTFSPAPMTKKYHLDRCFEWLTRNCKEEFQLGATEHGAIPMGLRPKSSETKCSVGSNAGAIRPATGYAFVRAQEQARQVAHQVLSLGGQPSKPYPRWLTYADSLFLRALLNAPERGGEIMERLLCHARGDSLVAFLSGDVRLRDALSVWLSVPKRTMIRSLLRI
jgi:lycopene beta-cyclase